MTIKRIRVTNFKSFENLDIELSRFNVLIGANASGKSNFVSIFKFLRDILTAGLDNAVSMQGGVEYLRNMNIGASEDLFIEFVSDREFGWLRLRTEKGLIGIKIYETAYKFALGFYKKGSGFRIAEDKLFMKCGFVRLHDRQKGKPEEMLGRGEIRIFRSNGKISVNLDIPKGLPLKEEDILPPFFREERLSQHVLLLEGPLFILLPRFPLLEICRNISIYDFDPKLPKRATPITGKAELEEDGSNLSIILKKVLENKEKSRTFFNLIKDLLPFVEGLGVEKFADKSLLFKLQETYFRNQHLPASLISDGTINIAALIIALYFEKKPVIIIEEPERNIHPHLISKVVDMMKDVSVNKQIIVTTHNPEIVKHAGLENLLFVYRDERGFSKISRPADKEEVRVFLSNDIGIEELYVQNLLEG